MAQSGSAQSGSAQAAVAESNRLTAAWALATVDGRGTAFSGAAVWPLLAYLARAADGDGQAELTAAVGLPPEEATVAANELVAGIQATPGTGAALGVWVRPPLVLHPEWVAAVPVGTPQLLEDDAAVQAWVREQTGGLLAGLSAPIDPDSALLLLMALVVRTRWRQPFTADWLSPDQGPWGGRHVASLARKGPDRDDLTVYDTPAGPVTTLAVDGTDEVTVHVVLGGGDAAPGPVLAAAIEALDGTHPGRAGSLLDPHQPAPGLEFGFASFGSEPVLLARLPRFTVTASHDLLSHGAIFGLVTVTDRSRQRLPGLSDTPLAVSAARQDVTAAFTADGFEAAAVTEVVISVAGIPEEVPQNIVVTFDRPFGFVARNRISGLVLVAGWVSEVEDIDWPPEGW